MCKRHFAPPIGGGPICKVGHPINLDGLGCQAQTLGLRNGIQQGAHEGHNVDGSVLCGRTLATSLVGQSYSSVAVRRFIATGHVGFAITPQRTGSPLAHGDIVQQVRGRIVQCAIENENNQGNPHWRRPGCRYLKTWTTKPHMANAKGLRGDRKDRHGLVSLGSRHKQGCKTR